MKKHTSKFFGAVALLGMVATVQAAPLFSVGDNLDVFFDGKLKGQYNSNVTSAHSNKVEDYALIMSPGVVVNWGRNSKVSANASFHEDMIRYLDNARYNENLAKAFFDLTYQGDPFSAKLNVSYVQNYQNTPSAIVPGVTNQDIIRSDTFTAGAMGYYNISPKTSLELGFNYTNQRYVEGWDYLYNDRNIYNIPISIYYSVTPQLDLGLFFQYSYEQLDDAKGVTGLGWSVAPGRNRSNYFGGVSARVKSWERLSGLVNVGVTMVDIDDYTWQGLLIAPSSTFTNFGADIALTYELTQKINLTAKGYQNYSVGAAGQNIKNLGGAFDGRYQINQFFDLTATFIRYTHSTYTDTSRADDTYSSGLTFGYNPNSYLRFTAGYTYFMNSSNVTYGTYNMNLAFVSGTLRY